MPFAGLNEELIARLKAGDDHAFVELFSRYRTRLKQMLEFRMDRRLRGREDASDILQEVYIDAHQRMPHYLKRPELSFYIWLRQLTTQIPTNTSSGRRKSGHPDGDPEWGLCAIRE